MQEACAFGAEHDQVGRHRVGLTRDLVHDAALHQGRFEGHQAIDCKGVGQCLQFSSCLFDERRFDGAAQAQRLLQLRRHAGMAAKGSTAEADADARDPPGLDRAHGQGG